MQIRDLEEVRAGLSVEKQVSISIQPRSRRISQGVQTVDDPEEELGQCDQESTTKNTLLSRGLLPGISNIPKRTS